MRDDLLAAPALTAALDRAAETPRGMTFHDARGAVSRVAPYAGLREGALAIGGRLRARGLEPGDRVAILAETGAPFVETLMGCLYAGLLPCPAPLPAAFGARALYAGQLAALVRSAGARAVVAPGMFGDWVAEDLAGEGLVFAGPLPALDAAPETLGQAAPAPDALAYLQFSSGTTRSPKGVAVTHRAMMANIRGMARALEVDPARDRGVNWLPWYHDMGLVGSVMLPIACGLDAHYLATRDFVVRPGLWTELISRIGGTLSYAPSFGYELAARRARPEGLNLSSWRVAGVGGDMVRARALDDFAGTFAPAGFRRQAFLPSYGMAEATLGVTFPPLGRGARRETVDAVRLVETGEAAPVAGEGRARELVFCGTPLPGHALEIRDAAGRALGEGRVGRVFVRGPSLMSGYFNEPEETARALSPDGWLDTGDLGYRRDGELVVAGRLKDMLIVNGRNVWPQDVEWTVEGAVEGGREGGVAVFAVPHEARPDEERVVIVVECRFNDAPRREAMREAAHAAARAAHGLQAEIALCAPRALPRTSSGKLMRRRARDLFLAGELAT